jgi:putative FmdB family regulatory protein
MPIYEFQCQTCEHIFTESQGMNSEKIATCPKCGSGRATRIFSPPYIQPGSIDRVRDVSWIDKDIERKVKKG